MAAKRVIVFIWAFWSHLFATSWLASPSETRTNTTHEKLREEISPVFGTYVRMSIQHENEQQLLTPTLGVKGTLRTVLIHQMGLFDFSTYSCLPRPGWRRRRTRARTRYRRRLGRRWPRRRHRTPTAVTPPRCSCARPSVCKKETQRR